MYLLPKTREGLFQLFSSIIRFTVCYGEVPTVKENGNIILQQNCKPGMAPSVKNGDFWTPSYRPQPSKLNESPKYPTSENSLIFLVGLQK